MPPVRRKSNWLRHARLLFPLTLATVLAILRYSSYAQRILVVSNYADFSYRHQRNPPAPAFTFSSRHRPRIVLAADYLNSNGTSLSSLSRKGQPSALSKEENSMWNEDVQADIANDRYYREDSQYVAPRLRTAECEPLRPWQEWTLPSCNRAHEIDTSPSRWGSDPTNRLLAEGGYNYIFVFRLDDPASPNATFIMKTYEVADDGGGRLSNRTLDSARMDALVMERLSSSRNVMPIYSHCGISILTAQASGVFGGTLVFNTQTKVSNERKLDLAIQASAAFADLENIDGDGIAPYVHQDMAIWQFLYMSADDTVRLNDFNKGVLVTKNRTTGEPCTFDGPVDGAFRSPEEYNQMRLTSKSQVFSLGNVLQSILTRRRMWEQFETDEAVRHIASGERDYLPNDIANSSDPIITALRKSLDMCFIYNPAKRATAMNVTSFLKKTAESLKLTCRGGLSCY